MICPECGGKTREVARFCTSCGRKLKVPDSPPLAIEGEMVEVVVDSLPLSRDKRLQLLVLKQRDDDKYLAIVTYPYDTIAIQVKIQGLPVPRPLIHDLLYATFNALGAQIKSVSIDEIEDNSIMITTDERTLFARISVVANGKEVELDSRPSNAVALALRARVPIYASKKVLSQGGPVYNETGKVDIIGWDKYEPPA